MAVAATPSNDRWMQRAIDELGELQYNALPWLPQQLALPVDLRTRWLLDKRTAAAAGYACLNLEVPEGIPLDSQQVHGLVKACIGKDSSKEYVPVLTVKLSGNTVDHVAMWRLASEVMALGSHCMLRNLDLSQCSLPQDAFGWLSYLHPATEQLQRLDMSQNPLLRLSTAKQALEIQMLLEDAPLRLLSLHHTGMTNEDLCLLFTHLTANPDENAAQAYLTCLKLGPPVQWAGLTEQQTSQPVAFNSDALQQMTHLVEKLPELQLLQVWGLDESQQLCLTETWKSSKGEPCTVSLSNGSCRISSLASEGEHAVEQWPLKCKLPTEPPPAPPPPTPPGPSQEQTYQHSTKDNEDHARDDDPSGSPQPREADQIRLLPARHAGQPAAPHYSHHHKHSIAAGHARPPHHAPARPRPHPRAPHAQPHRRTWKPPNDTGEPAVSRLYASLGLGYEAPNSVDDDEFAEGGSDKRPIGHARLKPSVAGRRPASHGAARQRSRAVAPEYGGGREYDLEAEFMDELGPLPKDHAAPQASGAVNRPKQRRPQKRRYVDPSEEGAYDDPCLDAQNMEWQHNPEMLSTSRSPRPPRHAAPSPSPRGQLSSPGTDVESQEPSQDSPGARAPLDQPAGLDSDDNFEVSDDADEQQLRRGRWDEEEGRDAYSDGSEPDGVPAVKPGNMSKREWELLQEARELEQGAFAFDKNRSKYQPRGHFDAAVGGRRRPQRAGTGSALAQLRQHRLQQAAVSGAIAGPSNLDLPRQQPATSPSPAAAAANTASRSKAQGRRGHFIDDQAAGDSSPSLLDRPGKHQSANPTGQATSSSSESGSPLAAKPHRSRSLQRHASKSSDTSDFSSNAGSPAAASRPDQNHRQKKKGMPCQRSLGRLGVGSLPRGSPITGHDAAVGADRLQVTSVVGSGGVLQSKAAGLPTTGGQQSTSAAEDISSNPDGGVSEHDVEGDGMPQEEQAEPAFELPSQMPRELQSWAWDKRAGQHPPNLQKIYPAQAKRVRKAPQRYSGGEVAPPLHPSHFEEHRPAQPHSHSGKKRKTRKANPAGAETPMQAAKGSSSNTDDDEDDTPLAMLPVSTSRAGHTAPSAEQTPAGPVRQLPQLSNPACNDTPAASSSTPHEQSDLPAAWQSMHVKAAWLPSMQGATDAPALTPHTGIAGALDAADRTEDAAAVPQATASPPAEARQEVHSSPAKAEGDMNQDRRYPQEPAVSMQELQITVASGLQAIPDFGTFLAADAVDRAQPSDRQDHLVSDSESEGPPGMSSQVLPSSPEEVLGSVNNMAAPVHSSATTYLEANSNAAPTTGPLQSQQQLQQQQACYSPAADAVFPVDTSSESLLQAEAEAARLALLLAPPVYHPPALGEQLVQLGTGLPVHDSGTASIHAPRHAHSESAQAKSIMAGKAMLVNEQSQPSDTRTAEVELLGTVQHLQAAGESSAWLGPALLPGPPRQGGMQQENAKVAAVNGLQQLAMQVNEQRLEEFGDPEMADERPAASSEQEHAVLLEEEAADVVIPDSEEQEL